MIVRRCSSETTVLAGEVGATATDDDSLAGAANHRPSSSRPAFTANPAVADRFSLTRTVTTTATANILQITYNVSWRGLDGRSTSRTMTAHYARYGIHDFIYNGS